MKFRCKECQEEFTEKGEASLHAYDAHEMEYEDCITEVEEENLIDDSPEPQEILDETSAINERVEKAKVILENYDKIEDESTKKAVLSTSLGIETGKDKKLPKHIKVEEAFKEYYNKAIEKLQDERMTSCPVCERLWKTIYKDMGENLSQHSNLEVKVPLMRISHIKAEHKGLWKVLKHLFGVGAEDIPDERPSTVPNPEQCNLSKEELAEELSKSPELRRQFFRKWLESLKERD